MWYHAITDFADSRRYWWNRSRQDLVKEVLLPVISKHPSLHFKRLGEVWSVRVGAHYRALGTEVQDAILWVWIGTHGEYDKIVG